MGVIAGWTLTVFLMILLIAAVIFGIVYVARKGVPHRAVRRTARRKE
ncbi:hypothetical protein [Arthrobacter sunyaminii]|uniref:Uncharacterized protein n=1 Tax=Arthrobacter sunyaminii TaxID=2816859 RepID=A0A975S6D7_9MICC|nr:hypothetical protein [Arthrobacter sunyaminii]MBO0909876.1 hypothetical protein [Arthrobacter sunyaminii]QWQ36662.1 hypothetical protein KG104_02295 [Arthrobacter sunyaminii]